MTMDIGQNGEKGVGLILQEGAIQRPGWWYRKGMSRNFSLTSQIFFWDSCYVFFVNGLCYSCYSPNIPSNNSTVRNQDAWPYWFSLICLTEKNEYWVHSVCVPQVSEKEGWQVSMQGGIPKRGNNTPFPTMLAWNLVFTIRWDKLFPFNSFFNDIQLIEPFLEVFI